MKAKAFKDYSHLMFGISMAVEFDGMRADARMGLRYIPEPRILQFLL